MMLWDLVTKYASRSGGGGLPQKTFDQVANLYYWLDAMTASYLKKLDSSPVSSDGDEIITATDRNGGAQVLSAIGTGAAPLWKLNRQNGLPAIYFGGVDEGMTSTWNIGNAGMNDGDWCVICAFKPIALDTNSGTVYANDTVWNATSGYQGIYMKSSPTIQAYNYDGNGATSDVTNPQAIVVGTPIIVVTYQTGGRLYNRINNGTPEEITNGNEASSSPTFRVGYAASNSVFTELDLYTLGFWSVKPSDADIQLLVNGIINKWAIAV